MRAISTSTTTIYTIGHSNHGIKEFMALLRLHDIKTVVDVRTIPFSRYTPHFNQGALKNSLWEAAIQYLYLGAELGGHPNPAEFYDKNDRVIYERIAAKKEFRRGIKKVIQLAEKTRLALMCTEEPPAKCHRHPLLAHVLLERNLLVDHIRGDGTLQNAKSLTAQLPNPQLPLFELAGEDLSWRSPKRIRRTTTQRKPRLGHNATNR